MTEECVFCQIIRQVAPSSSVYEDEIVIAFLSNRPVNPGHTLVVPRKHYENIYQIDDEEIAHISKVTKRIASAVNKAIHPEGIRIVQNNGDAAGQVISHLHVHVIPMYKQLSTFHGEIRERDTLENDAKKIRMFI
jgi:histidine triad (HIT) family protein